MRNVILIADSGTTKTDWCIIKSGHVVKMIQTKGLNPYFQSYEEIADEVKNALIPQIDCIIDKIYFYGAGCVFDKADVMRRAISSRMPYSVITIYSDLLAAAHSTCGREEGIACILGTGSNSCFYNGMEIVKNIPPLGFILGDEGGGAMLGRLLVSDILKEILPVSVRSLFFSRFDLTQEDILEYVYRRPYPNRFLASLSPFLSENMNVPEIRSLVKDGFKSFLMRNVMQYDYKKYPVNFTGSVAYYYMNILQEVAEETGVRLGKIVKSPMDGLIDYYRVPNS